MRRVDAPEARGLRGQRNQLFRLGIGRGRIFQRSRETHGAVLHGFADKPLHLLELRGRGLLVVIPEHHAAHLRRANVIGNVDAYALSFEPREVLAEGAPVRLNMQMLITGAVCADHRLIQRRGGSALARNLRGDALIDLRGQPRIHKDRQLGLAEHVNEARRNHHPVRIDRARTRSAG